MGQELRIPRWRIRFTGLWQHADFMRLWTAQTISVFGSMIGGTALTFTAILFLNATPFQMGILSAMETAPAFAAGLFAGAWVDRLRRRPLMVLADVGRAVTLATIPVAALFGVLRIEQVFLVALVVSILSIFFNLAYQSYLPGLVGKENIVEGNSKVSASAAVAEFGGFSIGGWLVQALTAPLTILLDALSFLASAFFVSKIKAGEAQIPVELQPNLRREIGEGLRVVWRHPILRASGLTIVIQNLTGSMYGVLVVLYMSRGLGFDPGVLGMIWAVGGISSLIGAALVPRITRRVGVGVSMAGGLAVSTLAMLFIPMAQGATLASAALLIAAQLGDGFFVVYEINQVSLRQGITGDRLLGRVNATLGFLATGAALAGTLAGGVLGEWLGVRPTLFLTTAGAFLAVLSVVFSPLLRVKDLPVAGESLPVEVP